MFSFLKHISLFLIFWVVYIPAGLLAFLFQKIGLSNSRPKSNRVLYLAAFFEENAGYQYRVSKWAEMIRDQGTDVDIKGVFEKDEFEKLISANHPLLYIKSFVIRFVHVLQVRKYKTVIVRRELCVFNDYGNLFLEKLLLSLHPFVILDFDDDIAFAKKEGHGISSFGKLMLESDNKFTESLMLYKRFIVGSSYLKEYLISVNSDVDPNSIVVIPTCVDYHQLEAKKYQPTSKISFGWIGGNYNLRLLDKLIPSLNKLSSKYPFDLKVISGCEYKANTDFEIINLPWSMQSQIDQLREIDIGLMPLNYTAEDKGKCGFKLIQYMGLGIVSVASDVTVNHEIITDENNGYLVSDDSQWESVLEKVINNKSGFEEIGERARKSIHERYSFEANKEKYLSFIS